MLPLSVLDLSFVTTATPGAAAIRDTVELARALERLGYRRIWVAEHHNLPSVASGAPEIMIGAIAAATSRIRVGAGGVMLPNHAPLMVAERFKVLEALREQRIESPVLLLTARDTVRDKVTGLDLGADDYLTKPFAFEEFLARVRALLRRGGAARTPVLRLADLTLDPSTREVTRGSRRITLTAREYALLEYLLRSAGRILSRPMIAQHVWGVDFDTETNIIDVYVGYLRRKLDAEGESPLLHTVRGVGYVLKLES